MWRRRFLEPCKKSGYHSATENLMSTLGFIGCILGGQVVRCRAVEADNGNFDWNQLLGNLKKQSAVATCEDAQWCGRFIGNMFLGQAAEGPVINMDLSAGFYLAGLANFVVAAGVLKHAARSKT
jgi:hypothetical protein